MKDKLQKLSNPITLLLNAKNLFKSFSRMLRSAIITTVLLCLCTLTISDPLPDTYTYSFFFQVDIDSTIVYSPTHTSVIYSNNNTQCFVFRESFQQDESPQQKICLNETIFSIKYNPQADRVYVVTQAFENSTYWKYRIYMYPIVNGSIVKQPYLMLTKYYDLELVSYPIIDISKDYNVAFYLTGKFYVFKELENYTLDDLFYSQQVNFQIVSMQWHPLDLKILFIAGKGWNGVLNLETRTNDTISTMDIVRMNVMFNGSVVLLQEQVTIQNQTRVNVFSYLSQRVIFIEAYIDFILYEPALCSLESNIMVLVKDLNQLYIFNATYQEDSLIGGTFVFRRLDDLAFIPGISDGSMAVDGSQIYLRGYVPVKRLTRCPEGQYQAWNTCEKCSENCDSCHKESTACTSCFGGYFIQKQKCIDCGSVIKGCTTCSPLRCLICNETANFDDIPTQKSQCKCKYGTYLTNSGLECSWCGSVMDGCENCEESSKCIKCDEEKYFLDNETFLCKEKSKGWIIGVAIGAGVLVIAAAVVIVWYIKKRKAAPKEGYQKFEGDNSAITRKKESFIKSISSEKSSVQGEKPESIMESNNKIEQVLNKKPMDGRVDGDDDGKDGKNVTSQIKYDGQLSD